MEKLKIKNSCNGRGCSVERIILPYGIKSITIYSKMHGERNAIQKILPLSNLLLDKMVA